MRTKIIITLILSALPLVCSAQKWSISTNETAAAAAKEAEKKKQEARAKAKATKKAEQTKEK